MAACTSEHAQRHEGGEIACGGGWRGAGDAHVVAGAQATDKPVRASREQAQNGLPLPRVELSSHLIQKLRLMQDELDAAQGPSLRLDHRAREPQEPVRHLERSARILQRPVVVLAMLQQRAGNGCQSWRGEPLSQSFLGKGAADAPVAVLEGMDAFEPEMRQPRAGQRRERPCPLRAGLSEPRQEPIHFAEDLKGRRRFEVIRGEEGRPEMICIASGCVR